MQAIYAAASGMKGQQARLDTIANNIANSSTTGYKTTRVNFKDALYTLMDSPVSDSAEANLLRGSGVLVSSTATDFSGGAVSETEEPLDFAIQGDGFFTVRDSDGEIRYTRNGSFGLSSEGDGRYLVTAEGYYVLDSSGNRIRLPEDITDLSITGEGVLSTPEGDIARLGIAEFPNPGGLSAVGNTYYQATEVSGEPAATRDAVVEQGKLERSNVDMADEMTRLIRSQRAYSLASRALQTADDMEGLANNMH